MYSCGIENITIIDQFSETEKINYINNVYHGMITIDNLDMSLYLKMTDLMVKELKKGWGYEPSEALNKKEYDVYFGMVTSLYEFSAAKQYQLVRELTDIKDKKENIIDYTDEAIKTYDKYNSKYFSVELDMCDIQGNSAKRWLDFVKWNDGES